MASYKVLKSIAHNIGHSFCSAMHYRDGDYVMAELLRYARAAGMGRLEADLHEGRGEPAQLCKGRVRDAVASCAADLPRMIASEGAQPGSVRSARMSIAFDLATERPVEHFPQFKESPYRCRVELVDDRGKSWKADVTGWWFEEAGEDAPSDFLERWTSDGGRPTTG